MANKRYRLQRIHGFSRVNRDMLRLNRIFMGYPYHGQWLGFQGRIVTGAGTHNQASAILRFGRYAYCPKASILLCVRGLVAEGVLVARHFPGEGRSYSPALLHTRESRIAVPPRLGPPKSGAPSICTRARLTASQTYSPKKAASKFRTDLSLRQSIKTQSIPIVALGWLFGASSCPSLWIAPRLFLPAGARRIQSLRPLLR